jgi:hypothetical protein
MNLDMSFKNSRSEFCCRCSLRFLCFSYLWWIWVGFLWVLKIFSWYTRFWLVWIVDVMSGQRAGLGQYGPKTPNCPKPRVSFQHPFRPLCSHGLGGYGFDESTVQFARFWLKKYFFFTLIKKGRKKIWEEEWKSNPIVKKKYVNLHPSSSTKSREI